MKNQLEIVKAKDDFFAIRIPHQSPASIEIWREGEELSGEWSHNFRDIYSDEFEDLEEILESLERYGFSEKEKLQIFKQGGFWQTYTKNDFYCFVGKQYETSLELLEDELSDDMHNCYFFYSKKELEDFHNKTKYNFHQGEKVERLILKEI